MRNLLACFAFAALFSACTGEDEKPAADTTGAACKVSSVNPNGDVELAILMREMVAWTDSAKSAVEQGKPIPAEPAKLNTLATAKRTDTDISDEEFFSWSQLYLGKVNEFKSAPKESQVEYFNAMVGACVSCHENYCHGPIKRINKLLIPVAKQ
jgi:hypothetical protein